VKSGDLHSIKTGLDGPFAEGASKTVGFVAIPKNRLMLIAGIVWCAAGAMVSRIGLPLLWANGGSQVVLDLLAVIVFLVFYLMIFSRLVVRHTARIRARPERRLPFWDFFDGRSYAVMVIMMAGGMWLRLSGTVPNWMIAFSYSGIGFALFSCGTRFLVVYWRKDVLMEAAAGGPSRPPS